jgi:hypothetical protein
VKSVIRALIPLLIAILVLSSVDIGYETGTQPDPDSLWAHAEYELNGVFWGAAYRKTRPPFGEPRGVYLLDVHLPRLPRFFPGIVLVPMGPSNRPSRLRRGCLRLSYGYLVACFGESFVDCGALRVITPGLCCHLITSSWFPRS